jgi:hypothetical protein
MSRLRMALSRSFVTGCAPPLAAIREIGASIPWISSLASRLRIRANARRHEETILSIWDSSAHTGSPMPGHWPIASRHLAMSCSSDKAFSSASRNDLRAVNWRAYGPSTFSLRPFQKPHAFSHSMRTCSASARLEKCSTVEHGRPPIFTVLITYTRSFTGLGRNNPHPSFPPFSMCSFSFRASSCNDLISVVSGNSIRVSSAVATSSSIDAITSRVTRRSSCHRDELPPRTSRKASFIHECDAPRSLLRVSRKDEKALQIASIPRIVSCQQIGKPFIGSMCRVLLFFDRACLIPHEIGKAFRGLAMYQAMQTQFPALSWREFAQRYKNALQIVGRILDTSCPKERYP